MIELEYIVTERLYDKDIKRFAEAYKEYCEGCKEFDDIPDDLKEWLYRHLIDDFDICGWEYEILNIEKILKEIEKYL